jgi:hypothetical protein
MKGMISKTLKIVMLVFAIWWAIYGLLHIVAPELMGAIDPAVERILGAAIVAFALAALLAYLTPLWESARLVVLALAVWMVLYTITMAWGLLSGSIIAAAWPPTIIGAIFAVLLVILYRREASRHS